MLIYDNEAVYNADSCLHISYLERTKSLLGNLATLSQELDNIIESKFKNSVNTLPKGILNVMLSYHYVSLN